MRISDWSSDVCSSDLDQRRGGARAALWLSDGQVPHRLCEQGGGDRNTVAGTRRRDVARGGGDGGVTLPSQFHRHSRRSEEHTSELQSLMRTSYAVFRLQKKKLTEF